MWRWEERYGDPAWHRKLAEQVVPHSHVVDKNQEGYLGSEGSQPQARPHSSGFQHQGDKSPYLLAVKISRNWGGGRNCWTSRRLCLKGRQELRTYTDPSPLEFTTRAIAGRVSVVYMELVK